MSLDYDSFVDIICLVLFVHMSVCLLVVGMYW